PGLDGTTRTSCPRAAHHDRRRHLRRGSRYRQVALGTVAPSPRRTGNARTRGPLTDHPLARRRHLRTGRVAATVPVHPGRHHLRRLRRDRTQHHCRARARPAEGGTPVTQPPQYPTGRNLLAGKIVAITAAAGTGIGSAVARRCLEEGASVEISDAHERRLKETAAELAELGPVHALPCDVTDVAQVDALISCTVDPYGRLAVLIINAGLGGTASVLAVSGGLWDTLVYVTVNGACRSPRGALPQFEAPGGGGAGVNN